MNNVIIKIANIYFCTQNIELKKKKPHSKCQVRKKPLVSLFGRSISLLLRKPNWLNMFEDNAKPTERKVHSVNSFSWLFCNLDAALKNRPQRTKFKHKLSISLNYQPKTAFLQGRPQYFLRSAGFFFSSAMFKCIHIRPIRISQNCTQCARFFFFSPLLQWVYTKHPLHWIPYHYRSIFVAFSAFRCVQKARKRNHLINYTALLFLPKQTHAWPTSHSVQRTLQTMQFTFNLFKTI